MLHINKIFAIERRYNNFIYTYTDLGASLVAQILKNLSAMQKTWVQSLDWEDSLEKGMATHSSPCLKNPMDRGVLQATVHGVTKTQTRLSD